MTELAKRRRAIMAGAGAAELPPEYQEVEWIGTTAGGPHITTAVAPEAGRIEYHIKLQVTGDSQYVSDWISMRSGVNTGQQGFTIKGSVTYANVRVDASNSSGAITASTSETSLQYTPGDIIDIDAILDPSNTSLSARFTIGQNTETVVKTGTIGYYRNGVIKLFGDRNSIYAVGRIYGHVTVSNNYREILHMVPCYVKVSGVIGMYDLVENHFYPNQGGTFVKGADV